MLQGRPLYDNAADAQYFVVPDVWDALVRAVDRSLNVLLSGKRGAGKTSLLRQLQLRMRERGDRVAFVDATAVSDAGQLAARIREALRGRPSADVAGFSTLRAPALNDPNPPPGGASRTLYENLTALSEVEPTTILVDASGSADAAYGVFGRMRDVLWQLKHNWVVAVDDDERLTLLKPPADAFFDAVIRLDAFPTERLINLLEKRDSDLDPRTRARIAAGAQGNPRAAIRAVSHAAVHGGDPAEQWQTRAMLIDQASSLGRPYGMLMAELLDLGQASPSDDALQHRLGLTRGRITHLMRELLEHGLVETAVDRTIEGPGRPKTIYRPALGDDE